MPACLLFIDALCTAPPSPLFKLSLTHTTQEANTHEDSGVAELDYEEFQFMARKLYDVCAIVCGM